MGNEKIAEISQFSEAVDKIIDSKIKGQQQKHGYGSCQKLS